MNNEFLEHKIFNELSDYIDFYDNLSSSVFSISNSGITGIIGNKDSVFFSSMQGTLDSIKIVLEKGRINDGYTLLRKYRDSAILNIYQILYKESVQTFENFLVENLNKWVKGKERMPMYKEMMEEIRKSEKLLIINSLLEKDQRYKNIHIRCNDHTHYNMFYYMMINDNQIYDTNRIKFLNIFSNDLRDIFILHFAYMFTLNDFYMKSSDYTDYLDAGLTPIEGSQYYVASFFQQMFDSVIKKYRNDIAEEIKNNTIMKLE
jgi:hypothetical protein